MLKTCLSTGWHEVAGSQRHLAAGCYASGGRQHSAKFRQRHKASRLQGLRQVRFGEFSALVVNLRGTRLEERVEDVGRRDEGDVA